MTSNNPAVSSQLRNALHRLQRNDAIQAGNWDRARQLQACIDAESDRAKSHEAQALAAAAAFARVVPLQAIAQREPVALELYGTANWVLNEEKLAALFNAHMEELRLAGWGGWELVLDHAARRVDAVNYR